MHFVVIEPKKKKQIKLHDLYEVSFKYMHGDADGYETNVVLRTKNFIDVMATIFVFHAYNNLYPNGRGGCDGYPLIWKRLEGDWPYSNDCCGNEASIDEVKLKYYDQGVALEMDIKYSPDDLAFIKTFENITKVAGGSVNNSENAVADFDWSTCADRIKEYCIKSYFTDCSFSPDINVTIFDEDFCWDCSKTPQK